MKQMTCTTSFITRHDYDFIWKERALLPTKKIRKAVITNSKRKILSK